LVLAIFMVGGRVLYHNDSVAQPFALLANERFGTLLLVALVYLGAAWTYRRVALGNDSETRLFNDIGPKLLDPMLAVLGNVVLLVALSLEVHSWFESAGAAATVPFSDLRMAEQATYSILLAV